MSGYSEDAFAKKIERLQREYPDFVILEQASSAITSGDSITVTMIQPPDIWPRFAAKVALAVASLVAPESWLDSSTARSLQEVLWQGPPSGGDYEPGIAWCPIPLQLPQGMPPVVPPEHLITFERAFGDQWLILVLFGELFYRIPFDVDSGGLEPQSWWFSPTHKNGRQLPCDIQFVLLASRFNGFFGS